PGYASRRRWKRGSPMRSTSWGSDSAARATSSALPTRVGTKAGVARRAPSTVERLSGSTTATSTRIGSALMAFVRERGSESQGKQGRTPAHAYMHDVRPFAGAPPVAFLALKPRHRPGGPVKARPALLTLLLLPACGASSTDGTPR